MVAGLFAAWFFAALLPGFLLYKTPPIDAEAVVLFLGTRDNARKKQVEDLIDRKQAKIVILPFQGKIFRGKTFQNPIAPDKITATAEKIKTTYLRRYVERTHVEMLQTKALMDNMGATSANLVSSPYHMRRIKIMAARIFDPEKYQIAFVPTVYESLHTPWFTSRRDLEWVLKEWGKIVWFLVYSPFV